MHYIANEIDYELQVEQRGDLRDAVTALDIAMICCKDANNKRATASLDRR